MDSFPASFEIFPESPLSSFCLLFTLLCRWVWTMAMRKPYSLSARCRVRTQRSWNSTSAARCTSPSAPPWSAYLTPPSTLCSRGAARTSCPATAEGASSSTAMGSCSDTCWTSYGIVSSSYRNTSRSGNVFSVRPSTSSWGNCLDFWAHVLPSKARSMTKAARATLRKVRRVASW